MKWKELGRLRQVLLILLAVMAAGFLVGYIVISAKPGIKYQSGFLVETQEGETTLYSGTVRMKKTVFTVSSSGEVTLRVGDNTFGPYTVTEDSEPLFQETSHDMGILIYEKGEQVFRGVYQKLGGYAMLMESPGKVWTGSSAGYFVGGSSNYGTPNWDPPFNLIVRMALGDAPVIYRGEWGFFWMGLVFSGAAALSMIYNERIFRRRIRINLENAENVEPSLWLEFSWGFGWVGLTILVLFAYILGLT